MGIYFTVYIKNKKIIWKQICLTESLYTTQFILVYLSIANVIVCLHKRHIQAVNRDKSKEKFEEQKINK